MQIATNTIGRRATDHETRLIAGRGRGRRVRAFEIDAVQHAKNLAAGPLANLEFRRGGAEAIACSDATVDVVCMFKSLHHVPVSGLPTALHEVARVLRPGGRLYVAEPVFAGAYNDLIRLFHDEQGVRQAAFDALVAAVADGWFELECETFFRVPVAFRDFAEFEARLIKVTHTEHRLSPLLHTQVERAFAQHMTAHGARFEAPMRVDVLRKPLH